MTVKPKRTKQGLSRCMVFLCVFVVFYTLLASAGPSKQKSSLKPTNKKTSSSPTDSKVSKDEVLLIKPGSSKTPVTQQKPRQETPGNAEIVAPVDDAVLKEIVPSHYISLQKIIDEAKENISKLDTAIEQKKIEDEIRSHYEKGVALEKLERYDEAKVEMAKVVELSDQAGFYKYVREQDARMKFEKQREHKLEVQEDKDNEYRERARRSYVKREEYQVQREKRAKRIAEEKAKIEKLRGKRLREIELKKKREQEKKELQLKKEKEESEKRLHQERMKSDPAYRKNYERSQELEGQKELIKKHVENSRNLYKQGKSGASMKEWKKALDLSKTPELHQYLTSLQNTD